ncbi:MAG: PQQ-like beta-propeller repeat protein [Verrucomicrobiae bacterium]|nr:PQQ-like beta-propeller repeat protein [Verrucomicrobiae bacterium]
MASEPPIPPAPTGFITRLVTLFFPPAGLVLLIRSRPGAKRLIGGVLFIGLYSVLYTGVILSALVKTKVVHLEWRGEGIPHLTRNPTRTDFDQLEAHRQQHTAKAITQRSGGAYWTGFRGRDRSGVYSEKTVNLAWDKSPPKLLWKQPVGGGYASFAIAKGIAYTIEQRREDEAVTAYDIRTGGELWANTWTAKFDEQMGGAGPRSTPTWHEDRVYALGGTGEFRCIDALTGETLWKRNVLTDTLGTTLYFASSASPLIHNDAVIVLGGEPAGAKGRGMIAYRCADGEILWQALEEKSAYSSPVHARLAGMNQILLFSGFNFMGMDPDTREILWKHPWEVEYNNAISQPLVTGTNRIFISAGYGKGCAQLELSNRDGKWTAEQLWKNPFMKNKFSSSVLHAGHLYGLDNDILVCMDAETGRKKWKDGRYGYGQIILVDDHVLVLCGDGDLALVKCNPERHEEIARLPALDGKTWNHPAMADGLLLIRNHASMACYDLNQTAN